MSETAAPASPSSGVQPASPAAGAGSPSPLAPAVVRPAGLERPGPEGRRRAIRAYLLARAGSDEPLRGQELADLFGVSRQVIVQDIAVLRAEGAPILATPQGYLWAGASQAPPAIRRILAVRHGPDDIEAELNAIVDQGATVVDVMVEHPVYGELRGLLMTRSRHDVQQFLRRLREHQAGPLLLLTGGVHLHTVEAPDEPTMQRAVAALAQLGFLIGARE